MRLVVVKRGFTCFHQRLIFRHSRFIDQGMRKFISPCWAVLGVRIYAKQCSSKEALNSSFSEDPIYTPDRVCFKYARQWFWFITFSDRFFEPREKVGPDFTSSVMCIFFGTCIINLMSSTLIFVSLLSNVALKVKVLPIQERNENV